LQYLSPQIIQQQGYNAYSVDFWALGVLLYELFHGYSPFYRAAIDTATKANGGKAKAGSGDDDEDPAVDSLAIYRAILRGKFTFSSSFMVGNSPAAIKTTKDFICRLLEPSVPRRLGCGEKQGKEVLRHPFFAGIDWPSMIAGKITPPVKPAARGPLGSRNSGEAAAAAEVKGFEGF
jgi:serine/threonine protein kinase